MNISEKTKKLIHLISDIVISAMLVVSGILFMISCYSVYTAEGLQKYTYESIGSAFGKIQVVVYITLALVAVGAVLAIIFPREDGRIKPGKRVKKSCISLRSRVNPTDLTDTETATLKKEAALRKYLLAGILSLVGLSSFLPLVYLLNPAAFPTTPGEYNNEVLEAFLFYLCMLLPLCIYGAVYYILTYRSYSRESDLLRNIIKTRATASRPANSSEDKSTAKNIDTCVNSSAGTEAEEQSPAEKIDKSPGRAMPSDEIFFIEKIKGFFRKHEKNITIFAKIGIGCLAVVLIAVGIANGGMADVLAKAVAICAECIGLG